MVITICGRRQTKVPQGELQTSVFGMVVVSDAESDVDGITRQKWNLLNPLCHVPTQSVERDLRAEIISDLIVVTFGYRSCSVTTTDRCSVWMTPRRCQNRRGGEFRLLYCETRLPRSQLQLDVLFFEDPRRRDELHSAGREGRLGVAHPIWL